LKKIKKKAIKLKLKRKWILLQRAEVVNIMLI
jgi:hypothetical protein